MSMNLRRLGFYAASCFLFTVILYSAASYRFISIVDSLAESESEPSFHLETSAGRISTLEVEWTSGRQSGQENKNYIHISTPRWWKPRVASRSDQWLIAPFCHVDTVQISRAHRRIYSILPHCRSLRMLDLRHSPGGTLQQWNRILRLPLQGLRIVDCELPAGSLQPLGAVGTIRHIELADEESCDASDIHSLALCDSIQSLSLINIGAIADGVMAATISKMKLLTSLQLAGNNVGEMTVCALYSIPSLRDVIVSDTGLDASVLRCVARCPNLRTVVISRSSVDDGLLADFANIMSLRTCALERRHLSVAAIERFKASRPDVSLVLLGVSP